MSIKNNYPSNVIKAVFGAHSVAAEPEKLKVFLENFIPRRLAAEEAELFFLRFRDGLSVKNIAAARGAAYAEVERINESTLRKIRHPASSGYLKAYLAD